jgi:chromosome segregation protein
VHLSAIKLRGFKSFPDPVEIRLEPGVAVVVGPNGSGKSNVADAIVWAAGSLAPSELRAEKPDDVLFAGGAERGAADFCEVELVFDNGDGAGPIEYSELSVARRLHRGGEGQYLLNRTAVRRIDLVELLADLGLGGGMHSVIGQGRVEEILASSPEQRRELVEEAAGLGRFKRRRHRAELKLARVQVQVERARDVEEEVRKRLRPLALQATAAERAERIAAELARVRARLAQLDLEAAEARRAEADERRSAATLARRLADERLEALLREREAAEEELTDAAGAREGATAALYRLRSAGERLGLRRETASQLLERVRDELAAASAGAASGETGLQRTAREASAALASARHEQSAVVQRAREVQSVLALVEHRSLVAAEARLESLLGDRASAEERLERESARRQVLYVLGSAIDRLALRRESAAELTTATEAAVGRAREARAAGKAPEELQAAATEAALGARRTALERDALAERARDARDRLLALERSLSEREGIPPAARALAEAGETLVLAGLDVAPGREKAVAAALGWRASALVADDPAAALRLLEQARERGLGSLSVLVGDRARELVHSVPVVPPDELLRSTGPAVTSDGFGFDPERRELWFVGQAAEAVFLELEARRRALAAEAADLEREAARAAREAESAAERAEEAEAALDAIRPLIGASRSDPAALERVLAGALRLDAVLAAAAGAVARLEPGLADAGAMEHAAAELRRLGELEADARRAAHEAREQLAAAERALAAVGGRVQVAVHDATLDADRFREAGARLVAAVESARAATVAAEARSREAEEPLAARRQRGAASPEALAALAAMAERLDASLSASIAVAERLEAPLRARVDAGSVRAGRLGEDLRRLGSAEADARRASSEAAERTAGIDVELARIEAETEAARRRLAAADAEPGAGEDRDELEVKAERLERRLDTLGRVNPFAREEYEAEKERLAELSTQREDLERSLDELEKLRADLAATVERRFAETYAAVERHFADVAATLFPGGEGRLRLTEPEEEEEEEDEGSAGGTSRFSQTPSPGSLRGQAASPPPSPGPVRGQAASPPPSPARLARTGRSAAAAIEIELRPAGKRITRLSLLSGGEKALAAISFLFALFLARPCPFYLLDEVEAALDDTNIGRFVELLRRYSDRAQFVVVTHQKRTMEAADVLYGVTMGADGVSQVVSRRLPREGAAALATA